VIAERGVAATRIADIAERCEVSPPAVLYWFDSKEQLLAEALVADDDQFYEELRERLAGAGNARERLAALFGAATDGAHDFALWMELWNQALRDEEMRQTRERFDARWRAEMSSRRTMRGATRAPWSWPRPICVRRTFPPCWMRTPPSTPTQALSASPPHQEVGRRDA